MTSPAWPHHAFDPARLSANGWRATAFREFIFKVAQRCNLACSYCYVYTKADQGWRTRPIFMRPQVWQAAAKRIAEHAQAHALPEVRLILHGGEPLLTGHGRLVEIVSEVREAVSSRCRVKATMQTNAVLLTRETASALRESRISVGVSIDGGSEDAMRHRLHPDGRSSFASVDRALRLLAEPENAVIYAGLICVIDPEADPVDLYEGLLAYRPPVMDFLLPHGNWADPPARPKQRSTGRWLIELFDRWYGAARQETRIRLFEEVIGLILGRASTSEHVGLSPVAVAVIESDGSIEQVDSLKSAYEGAAGTGLSVLEHPFDLALRHPGFVARQAGLAALSPSCLACPVHRVCGGGHYAHRFDAATGFRNRSIYCPDLYELIMHVALRLHSDVRLLRGSAQ